MQSVGCGYTCHLLPFAISVPGSLSAHQEPGDEARVKVTHLIVVHVQVLNVQTVFELLEVRLFVLKMVNFSDAP